MIGVDGPTIWPYRNIKAPIFNDLNNSAVVHPADALQVVDVKEQIRVAFVGLEVVNHGRVWLLDAAGQDHAAAFVLAAKGVSEQRLLSQDAPLLSAVEFAVFVRFRCAPAIHDAPCQKKAQHKAGPS